MSDQSIKTVGNYMSYGPDGERVAAFATEQDRTVFEAAPELLAALRDLMDAEGGEPGMTEDQKAAWLQAEAAIAKATGGQEGMEEPDGGCKATCPECDGTNLNEAGTKCWDCDPEVD